MSKFQVGEHVHSNSGLTYVVTAVRELDNAGSIGYDVRRFKFGKLSGPTRHVAESDLWSN